MMLGLQAVDPRYVIPGRFSLGFKAEQSDLLSRSIISQGYNGAYPVHVVCVTRQGGACQSFRASAA